MSGPAAASPRRVLVTGAGGFIGSHLTAHLVDRGDEVRALDLDIGRLAHLDRRPNLEAVQGDLNDFELQKSVLRGVDTVFHLAAAHLERDRSREYFWATNVRATRSLAAQALGAGVRRFVHCSTIGIYGRLQNPPADENTLGRPELAYELSKLAGEFEVRELAQAGLATVILRPVWVYGPGCPRTERLFRAIRRGRFLVAGKGDSLRHCLYIRDMIRALLCAATSEKAVDRVIIVGDSQAVTVRALIDQIAALTGARPPRSAPFKLISLAAHAAEKAFALIRREPPVSRRSLRFFTANTAFDTTLARLLLGFEPEYDLASGLAETCEILYPGTVRARPDLGVGRP